MTAGVEEQLDLEALLEEDVPCMWDPCDDAAVWRLSCRGCGLTIPICDRHFRRLRDLLELIRLMFVECNRCARKGYTVEEMWTVSPL